MSNIGKWKVSTTIIAIFGLLIWLYASPGREVAGESPTTATWEFSEDFRCFSVTDQGGSGWPARLYEDGRQVCNQTDALIQFTISEVPGGVYDIECPEGQSCDLPIPCFQKFQDADGNETFPFGRCETELPQIRINLFEVQETPEAEKQTMVTVWLPEDFNASHIHVTGCYRKPTFLGPGFGTVELYLCEEQLNQAWTNVQIGSVVMPVEKSAVESVKVLRLQQQQEYQFGPDYWDLIENGNDMGEADAAD